MSDTEKKETAAPDEPEHSDAEETGATPSEDGTGEAVEATEDAGAEPTEDAGDGEEPGADEDSVDVAPHASPEPDGESEVAGDDAAAEHADEADHDFHPEAEPDDLPTVTLIVWVLALVAVVAVGVVVVFQFFGFSNRMVQEDRAEAASQRETVTAPTRPGNIDDGIERLLANQDRYLSGVPGYPRPSEENEGSGQNTPAGGEAGGEEAEPENESQ